MLSHRVEIARREAKPEAVRDLARDAAEREIIARRPSHVLVPEHFPEVCCGRRVELPEWLASIPVLGARLDFSHLDANALGNEANRGWPIHAEPLLQKGEDVASLVADEAVVDPLPGGDGEVPVRA